MDAAVYEGVQGSFGFGAGDVLVARYLVGKDSPLANRTVADISRNLGVAAVAVANGTHSEYHAVDSDEPLREGQKVIALLTRSAVENLSIFQFRQD